MSVIAKMSIRAVHNFGSGRAVDLSCVCENALMAAYAGSEEDRLFTKYSPWGEIKLHQPENWCLGKQDDKFYVILMRADEVYLPEFPGAVAYAPCRVVSVTDYGAESRRVEICNSSNRKEGYRAIANFNWQMSVDNPGATNQMVPGVDDYWLAFYPAELGRDGTITKAHGHASE